MNTRREFLLTAPLSVLGASVILTPALAATTDSPAGTPPPMQPSATTPGAPPAFGTAPQVGPEVTPATFAEAEKLMQVAMTPAEREMAAGSWRRTLASVYERRTGPRKLALEAGIAPAGQWNPILPGMAPVSTDHVFNASRSDAGPLPADDAAIAYAPVWRQAQWIKARKLSAERLASIYYERIARLDPKLRAVITLVPREQALGTARAADAEIAAGKYRGPLHGIPFGVKDLLDSAGIATTWGAEPFRNNVPARDAVVVARLKAAGAVLIAKLSLGALALNDIWFGGQTMNPWLPEEGASGSSAGPGAAVAAGLVAFAIGSETEGSIIAPSMRCGVTGLRPTYGRVPRTGAMTLCWSMDKLGPMTRSVEDAMLVLHAISGPDPGDVGSVPAGLSFDADATVRGLRVGVFPQWMREAPATEVDRAALESLRSMGLHITDAALPDWPYDSMNLLLFAEAAAAFEDLTASGADDQLKVQVPDAWPNLFRQSRFLSAVDYVQADRLRRKVAMEMARLMSEVDLLLVPSLRGEMLTISNFTGHPSLTLRTGFVEVSQARSDWAPDPANPLPTFDPPRRVPHGVTLIGRLFDEGTIARVGLALERKANVAGQAPPGF